VRAHGAPRTTNYVGRAFVTEPDGDDIEVRASLRGGGEDWGGYLIGPADWIGIASSTEPFFELRLAGRTISGLREPVTPDGLGGAGSNRMAT
jgi:hypothetical protein